MSPLVHSTLPQRAAAASQRSLSRLIADLWRELVARWRRSRAVAAMQRDLASLDDATLRDLGMARSEAGSFAAEAYGLARRSRQRLMASGFDARMR